MELKPLYADDHVEVIADPDLLERSEAVVFSFTGGGLNQGQARVQAPEFVGTASRLGGLIVVTDRNRTWGNHVDWEAVKKAVHPYVDGKPLYSLGNSMGGFLAVLATSIWPVKAAIGFVPQFSPDPDLVPDEWRWFRWRLGIRDWNYRSLDGHIHPDSNYYLFYGLQREDLLHAYHFPGAPNLHRYVFPNQRHNVARWLKKKGVLDQVVQDCFAGTFTLDAIRPAVGSDNYEMFQRRRLEPGQRIRRREGYDEVSAKREQRKMRGRRG